MWPTGYAILIMIKDITYVLPVTYIQTNWYTMGDVVDTLLPSKLPGSSYSEVKNRLQSEWIT